MPRSSRRANRESLFRSRPDLPPAPEPGISRPRFRGRRASRAPTWRLDEPTTGLDDASTRRLETVLREHRDAGGLVIAATHIPLALADAQILSLGDFVPSRDEAALLSEF